MVLGISMARPTIGLRILSCDSKRTLSLNSLRFAQTYVKVRPSQLRGLRASLKTISAGTSPKLVIITNSLDIGMTSTYDATEELPKQYKLNSLHQGPLAADFISPFDT
jgi:hypothetical protein